jgi:hypothetical protein
METGRGNGREHFGIALFWKFGDNIFDTVEHFCINHGRISIRLNFLIQNTTGVILREELDMGIKFVK